MSSRYFKKLIKADFEAIQADSDSMEIECMSEIDQHWDDYIK